MRGRLWLLGIAVPTMCAALAATPAVARADGAKPHPPRMHAVAHARGAAARGSAVHVRKPHGPGAAEAPAPPAPPAPPAQRAALRAQTVSPAAAATAGPAAVPAAIGPAVIAPPPGPTAPVARPAALIRPAAGPNAGRRITSSSRRTASQSTASALRPGTASAAPAIPPIVIGSAGLAGPTPASLPAPTDWALLITVGVLAGLVALALLISNRRPRNELPPIPPLGRF